MFKIKVIRKDYNTQIAKKIYEGTKKFIRYGSDYFKRKHNTSNNAHRTEAYCKCFKMNIETEKWEEINPEDYFNNIHSSNGVGLHTDIHSTNRIGLHDVTVTEK